MDKTSKCFALFLSLLIAASCLTLSVVNPASAQTVPKPATPQFSIQYVDYSYNIPAYNSTNAFTGEQIHNPSQHIGDVRVEGKIKNQVFTRYSVPNPPDGAYSSDVGFYYNVRSKGHFGTEWTDIYGYHNADFIGQNSSSEYTNFTIYMQDFPEGSQIDYQVQALIGFPGTTYIGPYPQPIIIGEESEWSGTLTLVFTKNATAIAFASNIDNSPYPVLPTPSPSPSPTPTQTPTTTPSATPATPNLSTNQPSMVAIGISAVIVAVAAVGVLIYSRKRHR
jgi:hypothetical protein